MSTATEILRVRAAVRRRISNDPDTLAMADEIEALAELLDAIEGKAVDWRGLSADQSAAEWKRHIFDARDALERAITKESGRA